MYRRVEDGSKTFEIRNNDRDYQAGDTITLREFDPSLEVSTSKILNYKGMTSKQQKEAEDKERYTEKQMTFLIGYVMPLAQMPDISYAVLEVLHRDKGANLVILSLLPLEKEK
jgi:hypothetical protein